MSRSALIFLLFCGFLLVGCSKKIVPVIPPPARTLDIQEIDFEYMQGKARVDYKDDKKENDVKAHIRIRKDSVIWMNLSKVSVTGGKVLIDKDSITIVSALDKEYFVFDYVELSKRFNFNINYSVVQAAMLGNLIMPRTPSDVIVEDSVYNTLSQQQGTVSIKSFINRSTKKLERVELVEGTTSNAIQVQYSNFQPVGDKLFPYNGTISVQYKTNTGVIHTSITFEYTKAEVGDKELRFPFNIPKRYERR